jgi:hypothetical protein
MRRERLRQGLVTPRQTGRACLFRSNHPYFFIFFLILFAGTHPHFFPLLPRKSPNPDFFPSLIAFLSVSLVLLQDNHFCY